MKKFIGLMLAMITAAGTLAGCSSDTSGSTAAANPSTDPAGVEEQGSEVQQQAGASEYLTVVSREPGSGTRGAFIELFEIEVKDADGNKMDMTTDEANITSSTSVMMTTVAGDVDAIGYISLGSLNDTVKAVAIDGVAASVENIKNDTYKVSRPFNIATAEGLSEVAQDFIDYIMSADGQALIEDNGYIAVNDSAEAYTASGMEGKIVVAGSSSVTPVMEKLQEAYIALNPGVDIEIQQSDSSTGMTAAIDGICDIGMASREVKESELEAGLTPAVIAMDGIAVIVNNDNPVDALTSDQVFSIFTGEVTSWSQLG